jgi:sulfite reductase (NADPH) flavoprotein alpha-component
MSGTTYSTALTLVQNVAYLLSDRVYTYSPETFDLDTAVKQWKEAGQPNAFGFVPGVQVMETRLGAGSIALGYLFSADFDLSKRHIPQSIIASSGSLIQLRTSLEQLSLLSALTNPFVAHIAAVDYNAGMAAGLVPDYIAALSLADELGLGLVTSAAAHEAQHMALFATLLAKALPTIHLYDGITAGRETALVENVLDQNKLKSVYDSVLPILSGTEGKHSDNEGKAIKLLKALNTKLGTAYQAFEYHGHQAAETVIVVFGTAEAALASNVADSLSRHGQKIGVVNVRLYRPFIEEEFLHVLPKSTRSIAVLGQVHSEVDVADLDIYSLLYQDVVTALSLSAFDGRHISIEDAKYSKDRIWTVESLLGMFGKRLGIKLEEEHIFADDVQTQYSFWTLDASHASKAPTALGQLYSQASGLGVTVRTAHDNLVQGGVSLSKITVSPKSNPRAVGRDASHIVFVGSEKLLGEFDILSTVGAGGIIVLSLPGVGDEDLVKKIPERVRLGFLERGIRLAILDPSASSAVAGDSTLESTLVQLAFLKVLGEQSFDSLAQQLGVLSGRMEAIPILITELDQSLRQVEIPESWSELENPEEKPTTLPSNVNFNSFVSVTHEEQESTSRLENWTVAAKGAAFKEAYATNSAVRPDLGITTSVVTVKEHRRLTPLSYERNVFHIEFDLGNSGLTYKIGEALGIHAENDAGDIQEFIKWYGLDPNEVVQVPSREDAAVLENRTVYQALLQNVDIFGRPPKRFYEALAGFATDENQKNNLLILSQPEGATEFKRRAEVDTITFADVLVEFPSAHPLFSDIVRIVSPMKRREYSIASSQNVTPNSVSLLIVTLNWVDPQGRDRFGQATRYLNRLKQGIPVTVSIKPSVMKLPTKSTAPIIMAGLGTGLAPFRAFVQERAYQKHILGQDIGSVLLYMGSRHQREEYLYGEEWEAYQEAGIITLIGKAFSRDQPHKIYIQDRMRQTLDSIRKAYLHEEGSFYLCGPTWPVPDVTEVLQEAVEMDLKAKGVKKVDSMREIETLKEGGRFVLEVY